MAALRPTPRAAVAGIFTFLFSIASCLIIMQVRKKIRQTNRIADANVCCCEEDCCCATFCQFCTFTQILRHVIAAAPSAHGAPSHYNACTEDVTPAGPAV